MSAGSWAIEAVERAAYSRAISDVMEQLRHGEVTVFGLSSVQIAQLARFYEDTTGKMASEIGLDTPKTQG